MISSFLIFYIIFLTILLFFAYLAFAQWLATRDKLLLWYMGYLLFSFAHYGRDFWLNGFFRFHIFNAPPNPPFQWNSPTSYAAQACYFLFIAEVLNSRTASKSFRKILVRLASFFAVGVVLHLLIQFFWGSILADKIHQVNSVIIFPILVWIMVTLFHHAQQFYEKLILFGTIALIIGFLSAVSTRFLPRHDWIDGVICVYKTPWGWSFVLYHMKIGILIDVICFSWALTLRQKSQWSKPTQTIVKKEVIFPLSLPLPNDTFLQAINDYLAQHYHRETLNVAELAQNALHLSPDAVTRKLKEKKGLTTEQYILHYRLERALELLQSTDKSIGQISTLTGFKNDAHFSRVFKRHYDRTPGEMRRMMHLKDG